MHYDKPCTKEQFDEVHLMQDSRDHIFIDGLEMTARNIWEKIDDREALVEKLVEYFSSNEPPLGRMTDDECSKQIKKLIDKDPAEALDTSSGKIKNTSTLCLDVCRSFNAREFRDTRVNGTPSVNEVFKDKDLLRKILKNRLGWYTTTEKLSEDKKLRERPYLFDISW